MEDGPAFIAAALMERCGNAQRIRRLSVDGESRACWAIYALEEGVYQPLIFSTFRSAMFSSSPTL